MGYLDGLTDVSFKTDENGNTLFYPWGVFGKGYIVPDDKKNNIRLSIKRNMLIVVPLTLLIAIFLKGSPGTFIIVLSLDFIGYSIWMNRKIRGMAVSSIKLTFSDSLERSAHSYNSTILWLLEIGALLFVLVGILILFIIPTKWPIGLSSILIFGFSAYVFWNMIKTKRQQKT
jgi:hypothetical protein